VSGRESTERAGRAARADRTVVVTGLGALTPVGATAPALWDALAAGRSGISEITAFDTEGLPCRQGGEIVGFDPRDTLGQANFRPLDRTGRLATVTAALALADAGWDGADRRAGKGGSSGADAPEIGLVLGTMFGSVHTISQFDQRALVAGPQYAKPLDFANSVINAAAGQAAIWHRLTGVNGTVSGGTTAGVQAIAYASDLVAAGRADAVLAGGADELCFESFLGFVRGGFTAGSDDGPGSEPGASVPFHARRRGFLPGEGAALLMLETEATARARGGRILAEVRGHATAFDPSRGRDPARAVETVERVVRAALDSAGIGPEGVAFLSASASGRPTGDRSEAMGVAAALGDRARELPVTAVKGTLGEALGASGALQTVAALGGLARGELPGIPGLDATDEGFPLPLAGPEARPVDRSGAALVTAVGLDGNVCALVIAGREDLRETSRESREATKS